MFATSQQTHDAIMQRHEAEAAGAGGVGFSVTKSDHAGVGVGGNCVKTVVRGVPMGGMHSDGWYDPQHRRPGPLNGKPRMQWFCDMHYADGTIRTVG